MAEYTPDQNFKHPVCRGSWAFGNNCKVCERCQATHPGRAGTQLLTNPKHTDTSRSGELVEECRLDAKAFRENTVYDSDGDPIRLIANAERLDQYADRIEALEAENERLRKLTCATWFYMPDEGDRCWFSPHEVIDEMYDPEPGNHVFEVECATSLPSIWCAVRVTDDPDADERFTFTEHETEAEARAALGEKQ